MVDDDDDDSGIYILGPLKKYGILKRVLFIRYFILLPIFALNIIKFLFYYYYFFTFFVHHTFSVLLLFTPHFHFRPFPINLQ